MKSKFLVLCLICMLLMAGVIFTGCEAEECEETNACHGIVENGVFYGSSCGKSSCVVESMRTSGISNSWGYVFCNCED